MVPRAGRRILALPPFFQPARGHSSDNYYLLQAPRSAPPRLLIVFIKSLNLKGDIYCSVSELCIFRFELNEQLAPTTIRPIGLARLPVSHPLAGERHLTTASLGSISHF